MSARRSLVRNRSSATVKHRIAAQPCLTNPSPELNSRRSAVWMSDGDRTHGRTCSDQWWTSAGNPRAGSGNDQSRGIIARGLSKRFGRLQAVAGINLDFEPGRHRLSGAQRPARPRPCECSAVYCRRPGHDFCRGFDLRPTRGGPCRGLSARRFSVGIRNCVSRIPRIPGPALRSTQPAKAIDSAIERQRIGRCT